MDYLQPYKTAITKLCEAHKVRKLYAFGSVLNETFNINSDIDLIVEFANIEVEDYADNYFDFKFSLQDVLKRPIDLLEEQAIKKPYFKRTIDKQKQLLYYASEQTISEKQLKRIEESRLQIQQGNFLTNKQADIVAKNWLEN